MQRLAGSCRQLQGGVSIDCFDLVDCLLRRHPAQIVLNQVLIAAAVVGAKRLNMGWWLRGKPLIRSDEKRTPFAGTNNM